MGDPVVCHALYLIKCYSGKKLGKREREREERGRGGLNIQRASDCLARERKVPVLAAHIFPETRRVASH